MTEPLDHNQQAMVKTRDCVACGRTLELSPLRPGWTPRTDLGGWVCPECCRVMKRTHE